MVDGVGGSSGAGGSGAAGNTAGNGLGSIDSQNTPSPSAARQAAEPPSLDTLAAQPTTLESLAAQPTTLEALADVQPSFVCSLPALSVGFGVSAYSGVGGGATFGVSYDPRSGTLGADVGMEVGVGVGLAGRMDVGAQHSTTRSDVDRGVNVGIGVSANGQLNSLSARVEHELVGSKMHAPAAERTKVSVGGAGVGAAVNANIYAGGSVAGQLYDPGCSPRQPSS